MFYRLSSTITVVWIGSMLLKRCCSDGNLGSKVWLQLGRSEPPLYEITEMMECDHHLHPPVPREERRSLLGGRRGEKKLSLWPSHLLNLSSSSWATVRGSSRPAFDVVSEVFALRLPGSPLLLQITTKCPRDLRSACASLESRVKPETWRWLRLQSDSQVWRKQGVSHTQRMETWRFWDDAFTGSVSYWSAMLIFWWSPTRQQIDG